MTKPLIRYLGYQCTTNGGRRLQFSVGEDRSEDLMVMITISGAFFEGMGRISFQEAAGICSRKLQRDLDSGSLGNSAKKVTLTAVDIAQCRELARGRR